MLTGNVTVNQTFLHKITHAPPSKSADFDDITVVLPQAKASDKVHLSLIGAFQRPKDKALTLTLKSPMACSKSKTHF